MSPKKKPNRRPPAKGRPATRPADRPGSRPAARNPVIAARKSANNRTQILIAAGAVVVIAVIVVVGLVLSHKSTPAATGPGTSKATISSAGVITVGTSAPLTLDIYEDAICPYCGAFEQTYGQQMVNAVNQGKLVINYHLLTFLDAGSASKDYSSRGAAAMMCVAQKSGDSPGVFQDFHTAMFSTGFQPTEDGSTDHTNAELAAEAVKVKASAAAGSCITAGTNTALVKTEYAAASATLTTAVKGVQSPVVLDKGQVISTNSSNWLSTLIT